MPIQPRLCMQCLETSEPRFLVVYWRLRRVLLESKYETMNHVGTKVFFKISLQEIGASLAALCFNLKNGEPETKVSDKLISSVISDPRKAWPVWNNGWRSSARPRSGGMTMKTVLFRISTSKGTVLVSSKPSLSHESIRTDITQSLSHPLYLIFTPCLYSSPDLTQIFYVADQLSLSLLNRSRCTILLNKTYVKPGYDQTD